VVQIDLKESVAYYLWVKSLFALSSKRSKSCLLCRGLALHLFRSLRRRILRAADRCWVEIDWIVSRLVSSDLNLKLLFQSRRHVPGVMNVLSWHFLKLRAPHLDILSLWVEFLRLCKRVENEDSSWANSRGSTPAAVVWLNVVINQLLLKPMSSMSPILFQVHRKVAGNNHSATVGHEASQIHFTH